LEDIRKGDTMKKEAYLEPFKPFSLNFIRAYFITMRPYLMFVSGITGIVGLAYTNVLDTSTTVSVMIASFLSYGFGQALTDCFQTDTDSISSPYRPLTQGAVSKNHFLALSILGLIFCISVFVVHNPINIFFGTAAGLGLASYTYFKRKFWSGPFYNAWIVGVLCCLAFMCGEVDIKKIATSDFAYVVISVFFGYSNFVLSGYFKDIEADRATGYNTLPVKYGRKISILMSDLFACLMIFFGVLVVINEAKSFNITLFLIPSLVFLITSLVLTIAGQILLHGVQTDEKAHPAIALVVHSYILQFGGLALMRKPEWLVFLIVFYIGFIVVMKLRPAKNQI
jgi:4-hydroxybenzoate polyprenyltransferase